MRKVFAILVSLSMILSLTACGNVLDVVSELSKKDDTSVSQGGETQQKPDETKKPEENQVSIDLGGSVIKSQEEFEQYLWDSFDSTNVHNWINDVELTQSKRTDIANARFKEAFDIFDAKYPGADEFEVDSYSDGKMLSLRLSTVVNQDDYDYISLGIEADISSMNNANGDVVDGYESGVDFTLNCKTTSVEEIKSLMEEFKALCADYNLGVDTDKLYEALTWFYNNRETYYEYNERFEYNTAEYMVSAGGYAEDFVKLITIYLNDKGDIEISVSDYKGFLFVE